MKSLSAFVECAVKWVMLQNQWEKSFRDMLGLCRLHWSGDRAESQLLKDGQPGQNFRENLQQSAGYIPVRKLITQLYSQKPIIFLCSYLCFRELLIPPSKHLQLVGNWIQLKVKQSQVQLSNRLDWLHALHWQPGTNGDVLFSVYVYVQISYFCLSSSLHKLFSIPLPW